MDWKEIVALAQAAAQVGFSFVVVWWLLTRHDAYLNKLIEHEVREKETLDRIVAILEKGK